MDQIQSQGIRSNENGDLNVQKTLNIFKQEMLSQIKKYMDSQSKTLTENISEQLSEYANSQQTTDNQEHEKINQLKQLIKQRNVADAIEICIKNPNSEALWALLFTSVSPDFLFSKAQTNITGVIKIFEIFLKNFPLPGVEFSLFCDHLSEAAFILRINSNLLNARFKTTLEKLKAKITEYVTNKNVQSSSHKVLFRMVEALLRDIE